MIDNSFETFTFTFTDYDGVECTITRKSLDGLTWPAVIKDVCRVLEKAFNYEIMEEIEILGKPLDRYNNDQVFITKSMDTEDDEMELFPETKAGMTD